MNPSFLAQKHFESTKDYLVVLNINFLILLSKERGNIIRVGNTMHGEIFIACFMTDTIRRVAKVSKTYSL